MYLKEIKHWQSILVFHQMEVMSLYIMLYRYSDQANKVKIFKLVNVNRSYDMTTKETLWVNQ